MSKMKRLMSLVLAFAMIFSLALIPTVETQAATGVVPKVEIVTSKVTVAKGREATIKYKVTHEYATEMVYYAIYNSSGKLVADLEKYYYNTYSGGSYGTTNQTVTVDTGYLEMAAGTYKIVVTRNFKMSGEWYHATATQTSYLYVVSKPAKPVIVSGKNTSAGVGRVAWTCSTSSVVGYQVQCDTSSNFSHPKTKTTTNTYQSFGSLTKGKTYYFRVRSYKVKNGVKIYSSWSAKNAVKIYK